MLRLPRFGVVAPDSIEDVVAALQLPGARVIAGGTDILPNLKHRLDRPPVLVSLSRVAALREVRVVRGADHGNDDDGGGGFVGGFVGIGAAVTLTDLSRHPVVREHFPSLAEAAGLVASPSIRNMGTVGGNINLDTRCRYVNQSEFWRSAIGGCLKSEGDVCHVVKGGRNCVAAMSSDCAPVLTTLGATAVLVGPHGVRELALADYYNTDGVRHRNVDPGELTCEIRVPLPTGPRRAAYAKWTVRKSIDFPLVSVALRFDLDEDSVDAAITAVEICVGVLNAVPRRIKRTDSLLGARLSAPRTVDQVCDLVYKQCKPLENVPYEAVYRRKMLPVYTRRAMQRLVGAPAR